MQLAIRTSESWRRESTIGLVISERHKSRATHAFVMVDAQFVGRHTEPNKSKLESVQGVKSSMGSQPGI